MWSFPIWKSRRPDFVWSLAICRSPPRRMHFQASGRNVWSASHAPSGCCRRYGESWTWPQPQPRQRLCWWDVGPNLGACNRAALVAADYVVAPLAPDLYSLQGLRNLGPALRRWREQWSERRARNPVADLVTPAGSMNPIGYVLMQHPVRLDRPAKAYARCMERIPSVYAQAVRGSEAPTGATPESDPDCLVTLKHLRSLMPLAQEARKPMFALKPADGAIGGHASAVSACYRDFRDLALAVAKRAGVPLP